MKTLLQDLRFAGRLLLRSPGFSLLVVLTLALGIGANLAIFSVVDAVVLSPLPYEQPDRLVSIWETKVSEGLDYERIAPPNFADYRRLESVFEDAAAWWHPDVNLADAAGDPVRVTTVEATSNFFSVLGVRRMLTTAPCSRVSVALSRISRRTSRRWTWLRSASSSHSLELKR